MNKYHVGVIAIIIALGLSAFSKLNQIQTTDTRVFLFDGTGNFQSKSAMQNKANWDYEGHLSDIDLCDGYTAAKGCKIIIDDAQLTSIPTSINTRLSEVTSNNVVIDARNDVSTTYYRVYSVSNSSGYFATVSNQIAY